MAGEDLPRVKQEAENPIITGIKGLSELTKLFTKTPAQTITTTNSGLSPEAMNALMKQALDSSQGLARVATGQKQAGLYNSSTNMMLQNDLNTRIAGEIAARGPTSQTQVRGATPAPLNPGKSILGLLGTQLLSKKGRAGLSGLASGAVSAVTGDNGVNFSPTYTASIMSNDAALNSSMNAGAGMGYDVFGGASDVVDFTSGNFGSAWDYGPGNAMDLGNFGDAWDYGPGNIADLGNFGNAWDYGPGNIGDAAGIGDFSGIPIGSLFSAASGDVEGALQTGAGFWAGEMMLPGIGGPIGSLVGSLMGSVVCTHLYSVGLMTPALYCADVQYARDHMNPITLRGYRSWGVPLVRLMRKYPTLTRMIAPLAVARAREVTGFQRNFLGKLVRIGEIPCWVLGHFITSTRDTERSKSLYCSAHKSVGA